MKDPVAGGARTRAVLLAGAIVAAMASPSVLRRWPHDQAVRYRLGDAATSVRELDARWKDERGSEDWTREVSFRYAPKAAPRVITHEPRLPDGNYTVQIEIVAESARNVVERHVTLGGGITTIELGEAVPGAALGSARAPR